MLSVVENGLNASAVGGEDRLGACGEVDTVSRLSRRFGEKKSSSGDSQPSDIPVQTCGICLLVILPKARI